MRTRLLWTAATAVALLLSFGIFLVLRHQVPDRVHACGRDYGHRDGAAGPGPFTLSEMRAYGRGKIAKRSSIHGFEIWALPDCGFGVFVRTGDNRFVSYGLIGGP